MIDKQFLWQVQCVIGNYFGHDPHIKRAEGALTEIARMVVEELKEVSNDRQV